LHPRNEPQNSGEFRKSGAPFGIQHTTEAEKFKKEFRRQTAQILRTRGGMDLQKVRDDEIN
jgi:hypothetical protein